MSEVFDDVDVSRLRRRRTVKWTLYGPDVLAAWVAEMDFDAAPVVRVALLEAVEREDFGYVEADLTDLTTTVSDAAAAHAVTVVAAVPEATYLAWLDCAALGVDDPARFFLEHARVALSDGPPFGPGCEQHVRLNFATSRALLEQIVGAMGEAARTLPT